MMLIRRLKELLVIHDEQPAQADVKGESPTIQAMSLDSCSYEFEHGVLCRRFLRLKHCDPGTLQRIVPSLWRCQLWRHMPETECSGTTTGMVYPRIY